jgi:Aspartyl protease
MSRTIRGTGLDGVALAAITALALTAPADGADGPSPEQVLRENGLVRAGAAFIFSGEDDLRDRVAEIGRRFAAWKLEQAALDERIETLSRLRDEHQEIIKKMRSLETGGRPDSKEFRPPPFPGNRTRGPGSMLPPPDSGPFQPGPGHPPPPPDDMSGFGPGALDVLMRQLGGGDPRRQYGILNAERAARAAEIVRNQIFSEDIARRLDGELREIEQRRLEAVSLDNQFRARYDRLASDPGVKQALATLNESVDTKISLAPLKDDSKQLSELAGALAESRQRMLKRVEQVELKGLSRLTGLVGVADMLVQNMGLSAGRIQTLEREAASRKHLLSEQAKQQAILGERLRHASDCSERSQIAAQLHAKDSRGDKLLEEGAQSRELLGEAIHLLASEREDYLRIVNALKDAIDEADRERVTTANDARTKKSTKGARSGGERRADQVGSTDAFKIRLREYEKTIHSERVAVDADKTIHWVETTLNGKSRRLMIGRGIEEIRLSARLASDVGAHPAPGDPAVDIATVDGRTIPARPARLETVQVGPFTRRDVDCLVLPESAGDVPSVLGGEFFNEFSTRIDADAGAIVLTQVQVKPILHSSRAATAKSASSSKSRKTAPATARSSANGSGTP